MWQTVTHLEHIFETICTTSYPLEWDENHLSYQLMKELRGLFSNRTVHFNGWSKIVDWQSFKNRGKNETNYGDIAILVNVQFTSGEVLKGVALLEAKRIYDSGSFDSVDEDQLKRIWYNAPYSHLLLYTNQKQELQLKFPDESIWRSCMWVSPINTAKEIINQTQTRENWKILRTSFPFAMFLTGRIFWGFDLDYRDEVIADIEQGLQKIINPSFLGVVNVYYDHQKPAAIQLADLWQPIE